MAHILIVEDDPLNMELAVKLVGMKGHDVSEAITGEDALDMVKGSDFDLILLDIMLPGIDGLEVLAKLQDDPETAAIPVIAMTAYAMRGDRERFLNAGCVDYIAKPIDLDEFWRTLAKYVDE
ncbi:MAG: response regulator [Maridesulfovibrio ferrireducens]|nr:response regulator [Maridesulfovibrio ferrireducens]MBI9113360.1 response regulator [Maridesulfovibrio ferrireducens]